MSIIFNPYLQQYDKAGAHTEQKSASIENKVYTVSDEEREKDRLALDKAYSLFKELDEFKDKKDFRAFGFGVGGHYNEWLKRAESFPKEDENRVMRAYGLAVGEIANLAIHYAAEVPNVGWEYKHEGDMIYTRLLRIFTMQQRLDADFSDETEKAFSSKNKEVIGKWKLDSKKKEYSTFTLDIIYVDDNYYYCKTYANKSETERGKLIEALDRLYDATSIAGEYFEVSGKNLTTGDDYGTYLDYNITPLE